MNSSPLPVTQERPTRRRYVVMAFLCVLAFLSYFDRVCIERVQEDIQHELHIDDDRMGVIFGAFWLAYALFEIPSGWMGDCFGARLTLTRIVLAWSVFTALTGSATGFVPLLVFRLLFGVGEAGAFPNMARVQASWLPARSRSRAGGLLWLMARWGGAFAPLLFGLLTQGFDSVEFRGFLGNLGLPDDISPWRVAFWAAGLVGAIWCLTFFLWYRDDPAAVRSVNAAELRLIRSGETAGPPNHHMPARVWRGLLTSRSLWALTLLYLCSSFGWSFFVSWLPRYLKDVHKVEFNKSELLAGLPLFCQGISCLLGGILSDWAIRRVRRKWLGRALFPMCGYTLAAVSSCCVPLAQSAEQATALMCVTAAGIDFGQAANWATIVDIGGRYAGTATGLINLSSIANFLGPIIGPVIFNTLGWNVLFVVYAIAFLIAASTWFFIDPSRTFYREEAGPSEAGSSRGESDAPGT